MPSPNLRPQWWQLYLTFPLLMALFVVDARLKISVRGHQAVQIGILLFVDGLIHLWLKANASVLSEMDQRHYYQTLTLIRVPVSQLPDAEIGAQRSPISGLSVSEVKGVLSNTFDIEYIDGEVFSIEEVGQELRKESK